MRGDVTFPGFPCNDFNFHFEEAGAALAGLVTRDKTGAVVPGVLPSTDVLLTKGAGWTINSLPFVAARGKGRAVLLGGSAEALTVEVQPAPAANARLDVIYSLPAEVGSGDPVEALNVATGVAGAVPAKPGIPAGAIEMGTFLSQAGQASAAAGVLTNTFPFAVASGGVFIARTLAALNAVNLMDGATAYVLADKRKYTRTGGVWKRDTIIWATTGIVSGTTAQQNSVAVTFPTDLFPATPVVQITPYTTAPGGATVVTGVSGITRTGATVYLGRTSNLPTPFGLVAVLL